MNWQNRLLLPMSISAALLLGSTSEAKTYLTIASNPPGASVELNGEMAGKTPFRMSIPKGFLHVGEHFFVGKTLGQQIHLKLTLDGYLPVEADLATGPHTELATCEAPCWLLKSDQFDFILVRAGTPTPQSSNEAESKLSVSKASSAEDHFKRGDELLSNWNWDGAIAEYREALRLNPNNDRAHQSLGAALGTKGDLDGAIAEEREALRLNPNNAVAHNDLGMMLEGKGDLEGALDEYRAACTLDPQNSDFKKHYKRLLKKLK